MFHERPYTRSPEHTQKKWDWLLPTLHQAWRDFQETMTNLPDSPQKNAMLSMVQQANVFYSERNLNAMRPIIFSLSDGVKKSSLSASVKDKAQYVFSLFNDFIFFHEVSEKRGSDNPPSERS